MNEWIRVRDRLPENGTTVIAATSGAILGIVNYHEGFNVIKTGEGEYYRGAELHGVEYWQPAPAAPGKGQRREPTDCVRKLRQPDGLYVRLEDVLGLCPLIPEGPLPSEFVEFYANGIADYKAMLRRIK